VACALVDWAPTKCTHQSSLLGTGKGLGLPVEGLRGRRTRDQGGAACAHCLSESLAAPKAPNSVIPAEAPLRNVPTVPIRRSHRRDESGDHRLPPGR